MKVNMVVGGRFNAPPMAHALARLTDLRIYSSAPPSYWPGAGRCVTVVPHLSIIYNKLTKRLPGRTFKDVSTRLFSVAASLAMRDADVIYAWATFGYESMKKGRARGATVLLDRACPHIRSQEDLLTEEAESLGVRFVRSADTFVERCIEEYSLADLIVLPSRYTMRSFIEHGFPESKICLISLGPNFEPSSQKIPREHKEMFTLGVIAGSVLRKGLRYLVKAWNDLNLANAVLKLKCPIDELQKVPVLWKAIQSNPSIEIVGYMRSLEEFYRGCDLFCLPSVDDGFGMVVFEAIACGCPVLVTNNVGAADIVKEDETGFVVPARSSEALAQRIELLYRDRERLKRMADACLNFYREYRISASSFDRQVEDLVSNLEKRKARQ